MSRATIGSPVSLPRRWQPDAVDGFPLLAKVTSRAELDFVIGRVTGTLRWNDNNEVYRVQNGRCAWGM